MPSTGSVSRDITSFAYIYGGKCDIGKFHELSSLETLDATSASIRLRAYGALHGTLRSVVPD